MLKSAVSQCFDTTKYYLPREKLNYEVAYNWGFIWVDAGEAYFKVDTITENNKPCYFFDSYGESYKFYDWIYKVRDSYQSVATQQDLEPIWFSRNTNEGSHSVNNRYDFYPGEKLVNAKIQHNDEPVRFHSLPYETCTFDVLTAIYYTRSLEIDSYEIGEKIPIHFLIDGDFFELYIRFLGIENKKLRNGDVYECLKFSAMLVEGTIFKEGEDLMVWVTNDENKIPIMVEAKILIGSVKAYLTNWENLKKPLRPLLDGD